MLLVRLRAALDRFEAAGDRLKERVDRFVRVAAWWIAGAAVTLAYLALMGWLDAEDAKLGRRTANAAALEIELENVVLQERVRELSAAAGTRNLFYLIESGSTQQAVDKLHRLAMLLATHSYDLSESSEPEVNP